MKGTDWWGIPIVIGVAIIAIGLYRHQKKIEHEAWRRFFGISKARDEGRDYITPGWD